MNIYHRLADVPPCQILLSEETRSQGRIFIPISIDQLRITTWRYRYLSEVIQYPARLFFRVDTRAGENSGKFIQKLNQQFNCVDVYRNSEKQKNMHIIVRDLYFSSPQAMKTWVLDFMENDKMLNMLDMQIYRKNAIIRIPRALKRGRTDTYLPTLGCDHGDFLISLGNWQGGPRSILKFGFDNFNRRDHTNHTDRRN